MRKYFTRWLIHMTSLIVRFLSGVGLGAGFGVAIRTNSYKFVTS